MSISSTYYVWLLRWYFCVKKLQSQNITREKLGKALLYKKLTHKMLMKLTLWILFSFKKHCTSSISNSQKSIWILFVPLFFWYKCKVSKQKQITSKVGTTNQKVRKGGIKKYWLIFLSSFLFCHFGLMWLTCLSIVVI